MNLLEFCCKEGHIHLETISIDTLTSSQEYAHTFKKGAGVKANFIIRRICGKKNPDYDYEYSGRIGLKDIISETCKSVMRAIGKYRSLWFIVRLLDRSK